MYDSIVFPTDGKKSSERACEDAVELAEVHGSKLYVVHVVEDATLEVIHAASGGDRDELEERLENEGHVAVEEVAEVARRRGIEVETSLVRGEPDEEIVEYAEDVGADLIVMGTEDRPGEYRDLLGSVTERVLRRTSVPVTVVKTSA